MALVAGTEPMKNWARRHWEQLCLLRTPEPKKQGSRRRALTYRNRCKATLAEQLCLQEVSPGGRDGPVPSACERRADDRHRHNVCSVAGTGVCTHRAEPVQEGIVVMSIQHDLHV